MLPLANSSYGSRRQAGISTLLTFTVLLALAMCFGLGSTSARAEIVSGFPDGIVCTYSSGVPGPRVYYLVADEDVGSSRQIRYRLPRSAADFDYVFNETGAFVSDTEPATTNCDGQSIQDIVAAGHSFVFAASSGDMVPSGALLSIDAASCPAGWTRQVQLRGNGTPDEGVIVCRKD